MSNRVPRAGAGAIKVAIGCDSERPITVGCDSDESDWFSLAARKLLGKDAGIPLHYITGFPESSCRKYTARDEPRQPSGYFIRALLRTEQGGPFLDEIMLNCQAQWWLDLQHEREIGRDTIARVNRK